MIRPKYKVHLYKKKEGISDNSWSNDFIDITDSVLVDTNAGIETRKDTFSFSVYNRLERDTKRYTNSVGLRNLALNSYGIRDNIKIYFWNGNEPANLVNSMIMDGLVTDISMSANEVENIIKIDGANRSELFMNNMVPTVIGSPGSPIPDIIKGIALKVNELDNDKKLVAAKTNEPLYAFDNKNRRILLGSGNIQATHSDNTPFEPITYAQNWKNAYEQVEELSGPEYVDPVGSYPEEGAYMTDIININYTTPEGDILTYNSLRWRSKTTTVTGSLDETSSGSDSFADYSIQYGTFDVINAVIIAGGNNLVGGGVLRSAYNASSMGILGARWKFIPMVKTFDAVYNKEKPFITDTDGDRFPDSYPYTTQTLFNNVTANSNKEFNQALVDEVGSQIEKKGKQVVNLLGDARYKAKFELRYGINDYVLGELTYLNVPSVGWRGTGTDPGRVLRLVNYSHSFNQMGWTTTLFYEEDEKTISNIVNK